MTTFTETVSWDFSREYFFFPKSVSSLSLIIVFFAVLFFNDVSDIGDKLVIGTIDTSEKLAAF